MTGRWWLSVALAASVLGGLVLAACRGGAGPPPPGASSTPVETPRATAPALTPEATQPAATAPPDPTPTPAGQRIVVSGLTLDSANHGIELTLDLQNEGRRTLRVPFSPFDDLELTDNLGNPYTLLWAEYLGDQQVRPGGRIRLARAFFRTPDRTSGATELVLTVAPAGDMEGAVLSFPLRAVEAPEEELRPGSSVSRYGVTVTLERALFQRDPPGLEVLVSIRNDGAQPLEVAFTPERDMVLLDHRGLRHPHRWAEYQGRLEVPPRGQETLVRAFFVDVGNEHRPPGEPGEHLTLHLHAPLQVAGIAWEVPVPSTPTARPQPADEETPAPSRPQRQR